MDIEPLPDDCLPPSDVIRQLLRGPTVGPDGRIVGDIWDGLTPEQVLADYEAYRRMFGE